MKFHFKDNGQNCTAELLYNHLESEDCAMLVFENDFNEDILFSKIDGTWISTSGLQTRNPITYLSIIRELVLNFNQLGSL